MRAKKNHYELLKVDPKSSTPEIINAYKHAKAAFSRSAVSTYSLIEDGEAEGILNEIEEAYRTLTNVDARLEYDEWLSDASKGKAPKAGLNEREKTHKARSQKLKKQEKGAASSQAKPTPKEETPAAPLDQLNGEVLFGLRQQKGLSLEEVERITKIKKHHVDALERDDVSQLPARVYVQGFVKNLAHVYGINPQEAMQKYLNHLDGLDHKDSPLKPPTVD